MIDSRFLPYTVTLIHPATVTDRYGNTTYDYGTAATRTCINAMIQQASATESTPDGRTPVVGVWRLITDHCGIDATDRIEWEGAMFELDGPPWPAAEFSGTFHHTEAVLRRVEG
ncbi:hypothetical protein [Planobispora rosea]|uniref:hypothetical protein n=1 Tax=Planobispora rosea TaxID=35762 RepID=UPI00083B5852|nr:hypothetical protein [Planobispora rosea]